MHLRALYLVVSLFVRLELSRGILVNRTIDDQLGDSVTGVLPTYGGNNWKQGATCTGCFAQPDPSRAFQGTWHDATWTPGDPSEDIMTVNFAGSAVYVFIILANSVPFTTTLTSLSFTLDGELDGSFVHAPTTSTDYEYNVTAYANDNLANAQHTLIMQTAGNNATLVLFDYVVYSVDDEAPVTTSSPTSSPSPPPSPSSSSSSSFSSSSSPSPSTSPSPTDSTSATSTPTPAFPGENSSSSTTTHVSVPGGSSTFLGSTTPSSPKSAGPVSSVPSTTITSLTSAQADIAPRNGKNTKTIVGVSVGGLAVVALAIGLLLCWYRRRRNSISVPQIPSSDVVNGGRSLNGRPGSSHWEETTTGTWLTSSAPIGTYTSMLSHHDRSSVVPSTTIMPLLQGPRGNVAEYAHSSVEAKPSINGTESQAHNKSVERQLDLSRRIEQMGLETGLTIPTTLPDAGSGRELEVGSRPHGDTGEAEALREQVVFLLDEVERLHTQHGLNAGSFGADDEPPPDYSTEGRRSPLSQI
ncbi:hypothetical protein M0805_006724 [Coniferiporia weirii]|nr:hypothetical protein M0805_006724 [Coniferiporia weirii]